MNKVNIIILLIVLIVVLVCACIILFKYFNEKLFNVVNKLNGSEEEAYEKLKSKHEILTKMIKFVKTKYKVDSKIFEEIDKMQIEDLSSFKNEKILNKCYKEIIHIKEDNQKQKETKAFKELLTNYDENELHIVSLRTFHNKYTLVYNNLINKFPYNIISKLKKYSVRTLIEGKELSTNYNNDLEV